MGKGRAPCCDKSKVKKGPWSPAEDLRLIAFIQKNGHSNWRSLPKQAGLLRCGKSCRLRWINYLRPDVKRGNFTPEEENAIIKLHNSLGNRWSQIASHLPGRTDNEIKNIWNTHLKKRLTEKQPSHLSSSSPSSPSSSISSHASQVSNSTKSINGSVPPKGEIGSQFTFSDTNELMENIPFEFDNDIWSILDNLSSSEAQKDQTEFSLQSPKLQEETAKEVECMKWIKSLENELGLVGPNSDNLGHNNLADPFIDEYNHFECYSPVWPSSPLNFYI